MKSLLRFVPAVLVAILLGSIYTIRSGTERRLEKGKGEETPAFKEKRAQMAAKSPARVPLTGKPLPTEGWNVMMPSRELGRQLLDQIIASAKPPESKAHEGSSPMRVDVNKMQAVESKARKGVAAFSPIELASILSTTLGVKDNLIPLSDFYMIVAEGGALAGALEQLAKSPPGEVIAAFEGMDPLNLTRTEKLIPEALGKLAAVDPDAAWSWIARQPEGPLSAAARNAVLEQVSGGDAFTWLELVQQAESGGQLIAKGQRTALEYPGFRAAWVEKVVELRGPEAADDLRKFASELHETGGFEAARDFVGRHPELPEWEALVRSVAVSNLSRGGAAKADWLISHSTPGNLADNTRELMLAWTAKAPADAAAWLNAAPAGAVWRDSGLKAFVSAIAPHDLVAAREYASRIGNPAMREEMLVSLAGP